LGFQAQKQIGDKMKTTSYSKGIARGLLAMGIGTLLGSMTPTSASAQSDAATYPNRPIRMVVPYTPGGGNDILARLLAERAQAKWGQTVIVENRSGAGGNIGTEFVFRAVPDGYTLLFGARVPLVINKSLYGKVNFDPETFTPVGIIASGYSVLLVNPNVPATNLQELIAFARANPGKLNYASQGVGTSGHLSTELMNSMAGLKMTHIPYKGTGPAVVDLLSGQVQVFFGELSSALPHVRTGKLRMLGIGGPKRHPDFPDMPAITESLPGFQAPVWQGLVAPPGTPTAIANRWSDLINEVIRQPDVLKRLNDLGMIPGGGKPADMDQVMKEDRERWSNVIRLTGAKAE